MSHNPKELDDVDDDLFVSKKPQNYIFADKRANDITERTSRMLLNSRSLVQETENVGQSTLEMLSTQRETLERVENDLDSINAINRSTQKHLNSMRSFFGGIRSLFSSSNSSSQSGPMVPATRSGIPRSATLSNVPSSQINESSQGSTFRSSQSTFGGNSSNKLTHISNVTKPEEDDFEAGLSELGFGLGRLKEMASKLGDEIVDQNGLLDRITDKSDRASDSIRHQNRQMQQLLKKG